MKGIKLERRHSIAQSVAKVPSEDPWRKNHWSLRSFSTSGEDSWRKSHWREAIQLHEVWQELLRIKILKKYHQRIHEGKTMMHERNDTGKKQFKCMKCGKSFSWSWDLKRWSEDPWRKQPLKYTKCDRRFSTSGEHRWAWGGSDPPTYRILLM